MASIDTEASQPLPPPHLGHLQGLLALLQVHRQHSYFAKLFELPLDLIAAHGDIVRLPYYPGTVCVANPDAFQFINHTHKHLYTRQGFLWDRLRLMFGHGVLTVVDGARWAQQRKVAQAAFGRAQLAQAIPQMLQRSQALVHRLSQLAAHGPVNLSPSIDGFAARCLTDYLCPAPLPDAALQQILNAIVCGTNKVASGARLHASPWVPGWDNWVFHYHISRVNRIIKQFLSHPDTTRRPAMTPFHTAAATLGQPWLQAEMFTFLGAGIETTACSISWALYLLATHPEWIPRIRKELHERPLNGAASNFNLAQYPILKACIQEVLRLYPAVPIAFRTVQTAHGLQGLHLPANTSVHLNIYALHRHPKYWDQPNAFQPQRFLATQTARHTCYLPFGLGARSCVGAAFGQQELGIVLGQLLNAFEFSLPPGADAPTPHYAISLRAQALILALHPRASPVPSE